MTIQKKGSSESKKTKTEMSSKELAFLATELISHGKEKGTELIVKRGVHHREFEFPSKPQAGKRPTARNVLFSKDSKDNHWQIRSGEEVAFKFWKERQRVINNCSSIREMPDGIVEINGKKIGVYFKPSKYLSDLSEFWKLKSVLGPEYLEKKINQSKFFINDDTIEKWFEEFSDVFYYSPQESFLLSNCDGTWKTFAPFKKMSSIDALRTFGLNPLEEAIEKGIANVPFYVNS